MSAGPAGRATGWLARRGAWSRAGLALIAGAAMTLAQPPLSLPWVLFLAVPALAALATTARSPGAAAGLGWCAGFGHFATGLHWIGHAFLVDADRFAWALPLAVMLMPAGLALFWAAGFALARWLAPGAGWRGPVAFAVALTAVEFARGHVLTGFPWALAGYAWVETPVMQAGALTGPYGLTLLTLLLAGLGLGAGRVRVALAVAASVAGLWVWGGARLAGGPGPDPAAPVLRVVQQNAPQALKWTPPHRERFLERLIAETAAPPGRALGPPDAVIWPETAIPFLPQDDPAAVARVARAAGEAALATGALFYERRADGRRAFTNSLMVLGPDGRPAARYDKHHLVPFGEYMPLRHLLERIGLEALAGMRGAGLVPGPGPRIIAAAGLPAFAPAICYEMIFPGRIVPPGPRPRWILTVTNDAWFGRFAGPWQHLAQARARAIEQGLPVVRAAQTGISAVIDAAGRVVAAVPLDTAGRIDARLPAARAPTPYARAGEIPALAALALLAAGLAAARRRA